MPINEVHLNDFGTIFQFEIKDEDDAVVDVSTATTREIVFKKLTGDILSKTASLVNAGTDGLVKYVIASGDIDTVGQWRVQGRVILSGKQFSSDIHTFKVFENLI